MSEPSAIGVRPVWLALRVRFGGILSSALPAGLRLGGAFLQLLASVLIARGLGASSAGGFFFWSMIFMTLGQISTFGLDRLALQQVPRFSDDPQGLVRFLGALRTTAVVFALGIALLVICYSGLVQPEVVRPVWWYFLPPICIVGVALCMINGEVMAGLGRPVLAVLYRHTLNSSMFVLALVVSASALTPDLALIFFSTAFLISGLGALRGPGFRLWRSHFVVPSLGEARGYFRQGLPICLSFIFAAMAYLIPLGILERTHPPAEVSYLTTAFRLFLLFEVLATAVHSLSMPELSRAAHAGDRLRVWGAYRGTLLKGVVLLVPAMVLTLWLAGPLMGIFGKDFGLEAASILRVFLMLGALSVALGPATHLILMVGQTRYLAFFAGVRMALTCGASIFFIPQYGTGAIALIFGVGILIEKGLCLWRCRSALNGGADEG